MRKFRENYYLCMNNNPSVVLALRSRSGSRKARGIWPSPKVQVKVGARSNPIRKKVLMEKRTGTAIIYIEDRENAQQVNAVLSRHADIILCRMGFPKQDNNSIISLILEGTTDEIGSLTGQLGRLNGIEVKSALLKPRKNEI